MDFSCFFESKKLIQISIQINMTRFDKPIALPTKYGSVIRRTKVYNFDVKKATPGRKPRTSLFIFQNADFQTYIKEKP
jgi:hypothetical protein